MKQEQFAIAVAVIVNDKGEILIAKRNQLDIPEIHGKLEFPGGGIDFGESPEEAVVREAKEESGLDVSIVRLLPKIYTNMWKWNDTEKQVLLLAYECKIVGGELGSTDSEIGELNFFKPDEIDYPNSMPKTKEIIDLLNS